MDSLYISQIREHMQKALEVTKNDLGTIRSGRATPALVEHIDVSAYGGSSKMKVRELATISVSDTKTILIHPFDPATKEEITKGIMEANVGLNPVIEGNEIRISIPPLSEERREEYIKLARAKLEAGKIMIRQIRHEEMAKLKRAFEAKDITEDERHRSEKQIQDVTDQMIGELDRLAQIKEQELRQI